MRITSIRLPKSQRFCLPVRAVKTHFGNFVDLSVYFGSLRKTFTFDSRCQNRPRVKGTIVASLQVPRSGPQILSLYAADRATYPNLAAADFEAVYVRQMSQWLAAKLQRRETEILGVEELIVEWTGIVHRVHKVRFL
jgi:hypothetical protein